MPEGTPVRPGRRRRRAARLKATTPEEAALIEAELGAALDKVPGKLTKLMYAIGRLTGTLAHLLRQCRPIRRLGHWLCVLILVVEVLRSLRSFKWYDVA